MVEKGTFVNLGLVLRYRLIDIDRLIEYIEENGGKIVYQTKSLSKLHIQSDEDLNGNSY